MALACAIAAAAEASGNYATDLATRLRRLPADARDEGGVRYGGPRYARRQRQGVRGVAGAAPALVQDLQRRVTAMIRLASHRREGLRAQPRQVRGRDTPGTAGVPGYPARAGHGRAARAVPAHAGDAEGPGRGPRQGLCGRAGDHTQAQMSRGARGIGRSRGAVFAAVMVVWVVASIVSGIAPRDRVTWFLEAAPVLIARAAAAGDARQIPVHHAGVRR